MNATSATDATTDGVGHLDLIVALGITAALNVAVFVPVVRATPARLPLGLAFALLVPGYVLVAAVFPERYTGDDQRESRLTPVGRTGTDGTGITFLERSLLAVGCSVLIVPTIGYLLNFTPFGVRVAPILLVASGFTVITAVLAWLRRLRVPFEERFRAVEPFNGRSLRALVSGRETSTAWTLLVVGAVAFFALSAGYAVVGASPSDGYSELYLLDETGDRLAEGNVSSGDGQQELQVGVTNHEGRPVEYTVVVLSQQVETGGNETEIRAETELDRFDVRATPGESVTRDTAVPGAASDSDRVTWLLYTDDAPDTVSGETAAYQVYLWLDTPGSANDTDAARRGGQTARTAGGDRT